MDPPRRSLADHAFILGMLKQRNDLREKLCKAWPAHQFGVLCKRIKIQRFVPFKKVCMYVLILLLVFLIIIIYGIYIIIIFYYFVFFIYFYFLILCRYLRLILLELLLI